jgi:hypothetical protein
VLLKFIKFFSLYIGFKATVVLDFDSMNPVCILIHSGALNDAKLLIKLGNTSKKMNNPKKRCHTF